MQRRNTVQRELVLSAVKQMGNHPTAEEIFTLIHANYPSVSKGTVYRNLNILAEEGLIRKLEMPGEPDRYDHTLGAHYHIRCVRCGRVFDVNADVLPVSGESVQLPGFVLLGCEVLFTGICTECNSKEG